MDTITWLTLVEVAERLRVSKSTAARIIGRGEIPAKKFGGQLRIDEAELRRYIEASDR